ncbi:MAG: NAD(P)-binding protein, partial [Trebonia sp.]
MTADVGIVGAGPAGLAAAVVAADAGMTVAVLDLAERIGGQYFRHSAAQAGAADGGPFHHNWRAFVALRGGFDRHLGTGRITYLPRHAVWSLQAAPDGVTIRAVEGERER